MIIVNQTAQLPVRLITAAGAPATNIAAADILNGVAQIIKGDNTTNTIAVVNGSTWIEVDSNQSPGLYHLRLTPGINTVLGPLQYTIYPSATAFTAFVGTESVVTDNTADISAIKAKTDNLPANPAATSDITAATTSIKGAQDLSISTIAGGTSFVSNSDNLHAIRLAIAGAGSDPWASLLSAYTTPGTMGYSLRVIQQVLAGKSSISINNDRLLVYDTDGSTILAQFYLTNENNQPSLYNIKNRVPV